MLQQKLHAVMPKSSVMHNAGAHNCMRTTICNDEGAENSQRLGLMSDMRSIVVELALEQYAGLGFVHASVCVCVGFVVCGAVHVHAIIITGHSHLRTFHTDLSHLNFELSKFTGLSLQWQLREIDCHRGSDARSFPFIRTSCRHVIPETFEHSLAAAKENGFQALQK